MNSSRCVGALLLAGLLSTVSCTDTDARHPLSPTPTRSNGFGRAPFAGVAGSSIVTAQHVANSFCPGVPPFIAPFDLSVEAFDADLVLEQVQGDFTDVFGITAPPITLTQPQLLASFGSTRIPAASSRTFPMQFPFGCGTVGTGRLTLLFVLRDQFGSPQTSGGVVTVR
jgi:hypothetical protein